MTIVDLLKGGNVWPNTEYVLDQVSKKYVGKNVVVTGACGSIGSELARFLVAAGANVVGVDFNELEISKHIQSDPLVSWELSDYEYYEVSSETDYVFHCAAFKHVDLSVSFAKAFMENNYSKFARFLEKLKTTLPMHGKVVLVSSDKAAGNSVLGKSKKAAEEEASVHGYVALRLVNTIRSRGSVLQIWDQSKNPWVCPDHVERYWMSVRDAMRALLEIAHYKSGVYTVHNVPLYNMGDMASSYEAIYDKKIRRTLSLRPGESDKEALVNDKESLESITAEIAKIL